MVQVRFIILLLCLLSLGCSNPFTTFYKPFDSTLRLKTDRNPERFKGSDAAEDYLNMIENNWSYVGYSSFTADAGDIDWDDAIAQAKKIGASAVIFYDPKFESSRSGAIPITTPDVTTSYSTANATAYGSGGTVRAYGSGTTTTYGSQTTMIPYTVNRYSYMVTYWDKRPQQWILGAYYQDLSRETRTAIGSNKGVILTAIIKGSPAFQADLLRGDIIKDIEGEEVLDIQRMYYLLDKFSGRAVSFTVLRRGIEQKITVILGTK